jgi:hypothetical protein
VMIKISRDVHSHACHFDIYTEGAGPSVSNFRLIIISLSCLHFCLRTFTCFYRLVSLEEKDLGSLTRIPQTGSSNRKSRLTWKTLKLLRLPNEKSSNLWVDSQARSRLRQHQDHQNS